MAAQTRTDYTNFPFVLSGEPLVKTAETLLTDAGRSAALVKNTLMSKISASGKWVPFTDNTASDGSEFPAGIIKADVSAAELVAGDVPDIPIIVGGEITIDVNQLVIENSKTLADVITSSGLTVGDELERHNIYVEATRAIDEFEN